MFPPSNDDDDVVIALRAHTQISALSLSVLPLCFNYCAHRLCKNERMNMKVYHAHIKLGFQMSLKDCCKTMNMHINLIDLYLLSSGIYKCIYAKKKAGKAAMIK